MYGLRSVAEATWAVVKRLVQVGVAVGAEDVAAVGALEAEGIGSGTTTCASPPNFPPVLTPFAHIVFIDMDADDLETSVAAPAGTT